MSSTKIAHVLLLVFAALELLPPSKRFPIVLTAALVLAFGPSEKETKDLVEYLKSL